MSATLDRGLGLLRFEWRYQTRALSYAASMLLMAFVPFATVITGFGPASTAINGPYIVAETIGIITLVSVFALPMLCIAAAVRDDEHRMRDVISSTSTPRALLLGSRFAGVLVAALAVMAIAVMVQAAAPFVVAVRAERLVAFSGGPYLSAFLLLAVPNTLFCAALLFLVAAASRSTLATFVASIAIYAGYAVTAMMVDSPLMAGTRPPTPELLARTALLDPFGLSAVFEQTRYWTPIERDTRLVTLSGNMLWNRLLVVGLSVLCLLPLPWLDRRASRRRTTRVTRATGRSNTAERIAEPAPDGSRAHTTAIARVVPEARASAAQWSALTSVGRLELSMLMRSWPLRALLVLWIVMIAIEADGQLAGGEYGTRILASSAVVADAVPIGLWLIGTLCALYFAAESVSRERMLRFDGIRDATPVSGLALLIGKLGALLLIPVLLTIAGYGTAMVVHALAGGLPIDVRVYAAHALVSVVPLWITTVVAVALQLFVGNRWLGLFAGLVLAFLAEDGEDAGLEHLLTRFGASPPLRWSDLDGFGSTLPSWMAFNALWALGSLVLIIVAGALWPRGGHPRRLTVGRSRSTRTALLVTAGMFATAYAYLAYRTVVVAQWESSSDALAWRAGYERRYRRLLAVEQPHVIDVELNVALEPERRRAVVTGAMVVENRTARAIDTLWVMLPRDANDVQVQLAQRAPTAPDARYGMYPLPLSPAMAPGARETIRYALTLDRSGLRADGFDEDVAANGAFIRSSEVVPTLGYQGRFEIADSTERAARGLGSATPMLASTDSLDALVARSAQEGRSPGWFTVRTTISTSPDQTALGPGDLVKTWRANGRQYFSYRLDRPSTPLFAISSGRYAVERRTVGGVTVELWYHAAHGVQASRIVDIAGSSLTLLQQQFGAYPLKVLRFIEVPGSWGFGAYAQTGSIYLTESRGMLSDAREGDVDLLARRIGHEVAHQWWGHTVDPEWIEGRLTIVETLAKYSEQLLLDQAQGRAVLSRMMSFDHDRYLSGRANTLGLEPTLLTTADESHLYYGKGALAFHALRERLGDSAINGALRTLLARQSGPRGAATARELYTLLLATAPDDDARAVVREWFAERVIYDLVADSAAGERSGAGTRVVARFRVQRVRTDSAGEHIENADGAFASVGIFGGSDDAPRLLATVRQRVRDGAIAIDTVVAGSARLVEIDPDIRLIDRDRSNNRKVLSLSPDVP